VNALFDTDITIKLSSCNLLENTLRILGVTVDDVFVFREEAYRVYTYDPDVRKSYSPAAIQRAKKFINRVHRIETAVDLEEQAYMSAADIDSGEQVIFSATRETSDFVVLTADRKALKILAHANGCGGIQNRTAGRVLCPENVLLRLISAGDFAGVRNGVVACLSHVPDAPCDAAFADAFPDGAETTEAHAQATLRSRVQDLNRDTRRLVPLDQAPEQLRRRVPCFDVGRAPPAAPGGSSSLVLH
jgi:hypothetical protein